MVACDCKQYRCFVGGFISSGLGSGKFNSLRWSWNWRPWRPPFHTPLGADFPSLGFKEGSLIHGTVSIFLPLWFQDWGQCPRERDCSVQEQEIGASNGWAGSLCDTCYLRSQQHWEGVVCSKYRALFAGLCFAGSCSSPRAGVLHQNKLLGDVSKFFILLCLEECQFFFHSLIAKKLSELRALQSTMS